MEPTNITFRRLTLEDLPRMYNWISNDRLVNRFWAYNQKESYEQITKEFSDYIKRVEPTDPYLILYDDTQIGYIQTFQWRDYPVFEKYVNLSHAASLDLFIGEEAYRNRGLSTTILSQFLSQFVFSDEHVDRCIINPEVSNRNAIRAYEKIGFQIIKMVPDIPEEHGPVYFMRLDRQTFKDNYR
ncbi:GNAT family N-acetyltransferase [Thalassobacillus pellis]|uniref:GNAT family N-acetyltransferase n=1 Tax=Thalassobacillus pellis TaxID=748008 RepID=UPI00195FF000|nr:GNAT family N-acetyltransferase [Thalassobacillus pellis]MBM7554494.1 aminoglycoside 6'-N-acetyltransferase [Thalassobacillus pellis]